MAKQKKTKVEYRYYHMVPETYLFSLQGEEWIREYGKGINYLHYHNYLEIGYCMEGTGEMILLDKTYDYKKGCFTIIPKKYAHTTNSTPETKSWWSYLFVDEEGFLENIFPAKTQESKRRKLEECINNTAKIFTKEEYPELANNILELFRIMKEKKVFYEEEAEGLLAAMLIKTARINDEKSVLHSLEEEYYHQRTDESIVALALEYIGRHYTQKVHIEHIARYCNVSETHLRRLFTLRMKIGILEYINLARVQKACELLKKTEASIQEIAEKCGFLSVSTFNRNFKRYLGESPCNWRKRPENFEQKLKRVNIYSQGGW